MKTGIILIGLQLLALVGEYAESGGLIPQGGIIFQLVFFLPSIIGIVLIIRSLRLKNKHH